MALYNNPGYGIINNPRGTVNNPIVGTPLGTAQNPIQPQGQAGQAGQPVPFQNPFWSWLFPTGTMGPRVADFWGVQTAPQMSATGVPDVPVAPPANTPPANTMTENQYRDTMIANRNAAALEARQTDQLKRNAAYFQPPEGMQYSGRLSAAGRPIFEPLPASAQTPAAAQLSPEKASELKKFLIRRYLGTKLPG